MMISTDHCSCGWVDVPELVTLEDYIGKHKDNPELDEEVIANAKKLLAKVNSLLKDLGVKKVHVNSGWRPQAYNIKIGGAKRSRHIIGQAIDLADSDGSLKRLCEANVAELKKRGLSMEDGRYTPSWCHLQWPPPRSGRSIFIPYAGPPKV
jgi:hypothetical protein